MPQLDVMRFDHPILMQGGTLVWLKFYRANYVYFVITSFYIKPMFLIP